MRRARSEQKGDVRARITEVRHGQGRRLAGKFGVDGHDFLGRVVAPAAQQHAADVGASVRTLSRLFTRELGMGFAQWRRQVQLAIAVSRLAQGEPVSVVARAFGYLPSSFSDMFRRELGVPPSEFRPDETLGRTGAEIAQAAAAPSGI